MGILTRKPNAMHDLHFSKSDSHAAMTLSDPGQDSASLAQFLSERDLIIADDSLGMEMARERVEASGIVKIMLETSATVNRIVGRTIVDMHSFLLPEPIFCCFIYVENGTEYFMRLDLQGVIPTLSFSERNCRDTVSNDFVRWVHRIANVDPVTITVKLVHEFHEINVSIEQVREWFKYLISGLDRSYTPSFE